MNKDNEKHFGLRVDGDILAKFRYVCGYVGRSANSQIIQLIKYNMCRCNCVKNYYRQFKADTHILLAALRLE